MLEWMIAIVLGGFAYVAQRLHVIAAEQETLRAEIQELRKALDKGFDKNLRMLTDVIEIHLDVPDDKAIFRGKSKE